MEITDKRTEKRKEGDSGEEIAASYLRRFGYRIEARNFSCRNGELDIVAVQEKEGIIAFVEVKTRSRTDYGLPCEAVGLRKQRRLKRTAEYYLLTHSACRKYQPSMDIVEILKLNGEIYARHLKNAF